MKTIMVFGTFDGIHKGHIDFFRQSKENGDRLVAVVGRDSNVERIKGRKPINRQEHRLLETYNSEYVDEAMLGEENDPFSVIENVKPDVICLGYDQTEHTEELADEIKKRGLNIKILRMKAYMPEKYKSSIINKRE